MKTRAPISWYGSDSAVAEQLGGYFTGIDHVTIPFAGGMSILPFLPARSVLANDKHSFLHHFYQVIAGRLGEATQKRTIELCQKTLSHPQELEDASALLDQMDDVDPAVRAWAFWAICWVGRKGKGGTGGNNSVSFRRTPDGGTNATRITATASDLPLWAEQFKRCEFTCLDWTEVISKCLDNPRCGLYCDPPWVNGGDKYVWSFKEPDHRLLSEGLRRFNRTKVVVRYDDCALIRRLYAGWKIKPVSSRSQANTSVREVHIFNF